MDTELTRRAFVGLAAVCGAGIGITNISPDDHPKGTIVITKIVVHITDSPQGRGDDAADIHRWHQEKGFAGIGYHYVITEAGEVQAGRPEYWEGAHVKGHNDGSIGVVLVADRKLTRPQRAALYELLIELCGRHPRAIVYGHRDLDAKKRCPGFSVSQFLEEMRQERLNIQNIQRNQNEQRDW
jgi:N-acetylmuramoyl-L-alanine amidase